MSEKILVMCARDEICLNLSDVLTRAGYTVSTAGSWGDGARLFETGVPDLVIADAGMPIGRCLDMLRGAKDRRCDIDLIILASDGRDQAAAAEWLAKGAYDVLLEPLKDRRMLIAGVERALQKRRLVVRNDRLNKELARNAIRDSLTGLYNHDFMIKCVMDEIVRSTRYNHSFLLIMTDIDRFGELNAAFGRDFGDFVLTRLARLLEDSLRLTDSTYRYGGGKFLMMLPETNKTQAIRVAERILESVRYHDFSFEGRRSPVTVSMGAAEFPLEARDVPSLVDLAGRRLSLAKDSGHDCFDFEAQEDFSSGM